MPQKPLLLTLGDPAGIGPEITVKTWRALKDYPQYSFAVLAPPDAIAKATDNAGRDIELVDNLSNVTDVFRRAVPVLPISGSAATPGQPSSTHAGAVTQSIELAVKKALEGEAAAIVTNPIAKDVLYEAGFKYPGHTEYLGHLTADIEPPYARGPVMMLAGGGLRVGLATVHMSLKDAASELSSNAIINKARVMDGALRCDFGIDAPRLSLAGLNPHAGEGGALGREEIDIINPAAKILRAEGINITNARSADTLFHAEAREGYDAVLAMYHDQGLIPVKTLDFHGGVNITLGLPIVRTSPDHGTAFDIAGKNIARPDSLIAAIKLAREIADNRAAYTDKSHVS